MLNLSSSSRRNGIADSGIASRAGLGENNTLPASEGRLRSIRVIQRGLVISNRARRLGIYPVLTKKLCRVTFGVPAKTAVIYHIELASLTKRRPNLKFRIFVLGILAFAGVACIVLVSDHRTAGIPVLQDGVSSNDGNLIEASDRNFGEILGTCSRRKCTCDECEREPEISPTATEHIASLTPTI